jgi:hypothetical protein
MNGSQTTGDCVWEERITIISDTKIDAVGNFSS